RTTAAWANNKAADGQISPDSEDPAVVFYTVAAVAKLGLPQRSGPLFTLSSLAFSFARTGSCEPFGEKSINRLGYRSDGPGPPVLRYQMFEITLVRDVTELDQHRRHVGGLQHPEACGLQRVLVHPHRTLHLAHQQPG